MAAKSSVSGAATSCSFRGRLGMCIFYHLRCDNYAQCNNEDQTTLVRTEECSPFLDYCEQHRRSPITSNKRAFDPVKRPRDFVEAPHAALSIVLWHEGRDGWLRFSFFECIILCPAATSWLCHQCETRAQLPDTDAELSPGLDVNAWLSSDSQGTSPLQRYQSNPTESVADWYYDWDHLRDV